MSISFLLDICNNNIVNEIDDIARISPLLACCNHFYALQYADFVLRNRFPDGEFVIATDAKSSYWYAVSVLKGQFELGEKVIAESTEYAFCYALNIIKKQFKLGESAIAKDEWLSYRYADEVLKRDFYHNGKLICQVVENLFF